MRRWKLGCVFLGGRSLSGAREGDHGRALRQVAQHVLQPRKVQNPSGRGKKSAPLLAVDSEGSPKGKELSGIAPLGSRILPSAWLLGFSTDRLPLLFDRESWVQKNNFRTPRKARTAQSLRSAQARWIRIRATGVSSSVQQ